VIYHKPIKLGEPFLATANVTFGYQSARETFSVWFVAGQPENTSYIALGTGHETDAAGRVPRIKRLVATVCVDGFHVFHLCELEEGQ